MSLINDFNIKNPPRIDTINLMFWEYNQILLYLEKQINSLC